MARLAWTYEAGLWKAGPWTVFHDGKVWRAMLHWRLLTPSGSLTPMQWPTAEGAKLECERRAAKFAREAGVTVGTARCR